MAELGPIREEAATQVSRTRELGQKTGAGVVASTFNETNADEVNERLKAVQKQAASNIEAARAASTEQAGTAQNQQGNVQTQAGQTLIAAASVAAASGLGAPASLGMFAAGTALVVTGQGNQAQGEQKVAEAPPMISKAGDLSNQSEGHLNKAEQIRSEQEAEQATNEDSSDPNSANDPNSAKEIGKGKGYYVADSGNAGASTDVELVADRLTDAEKAINEKLGITTDSETAEGGIGTDDKTTIASRLKDGAGEVDNLLGVEKEKIG
ncbi:MAG: hypothetical protein VKK32_09920 [Candidatus Melainabacteria bacterium]|nr:hypothetical protein [Candidatus Melainabacteria bacterium]